MLTRKGLRIEGNKYPQLEVLVSYVSIHVWTLFCTFVCLSVYILVCVCLQLTYISLQLNHSVQPLSHRHTHKQQTSQATGKQHYLQANPSYGVRQLQTLHVTPPCHLHHTHVYAHTQRHTPQVSNHPAHFLTISSLSFPLPPSLHVILCHSPCAKLHWGELPQYWGIVSYTGNFLPRCQAYFTLICLQRLLIKQSCLYTYLYRSPACATLHTALNSMLLNIYLRWMSMEEE